MEWPDYFFGERTRLSLKHVMSVSMQICSFCKFACSSVAIKALTFLRRHRFHLVQVEVRVLLNLEQSSEIRWVSFQMPELIPVFSGKQEISIFFFSELRQRIARVCDTRKKISDDDGINISRANGKFMQDQSWFYFTENNA